MPATTEERERTVTTDGLDLTDHEIEFDRPVDRLKPVCAADQQTLTVIVDMVMSAHGRALERSAGLRSASKQSRDHVEAITYAVFSSRPGRYGSIEKQAADFAVRLATGHCFPDGNKRTAVLSAAVIMEAYGRSIACGQDEMVKAAMLAAAGDVDRVEAILCSGE